MRRSRMLVIVGLVLFAGSAGADLRLRMGATKPRALADAVSLAVATGALGKLPALRQKYGQDLGKLVPIKAFKPIKGINCDSE